MGRCYTAVGTMSRFSPPVACIHADPPEKSLRTSEMVGRGSPTGHRTASGSPHCAWTVVIAPGAGSADVGGEPAPERASRWAGRRAPTAGRPKLALKLEAADGQPHEHTGAFLGLDRQTRNQPDAVKYDSVRFQTERPDALRRRSSSSRSTTGLKRRVDLGCQHV
jgi:hypothetical protein